MTRTIKDVFNDVCKDFVVDADLLKSIQRFEHGFTHRNAEHIEFFGGHLLGVDKVRFLPTDWAMLFDSVFKIDDTELEKQMHSIPSINKDHTVASDVLNLTCIWVTYRILNTAPNKSMTKEDLLHGAINALLIFQYKVLTSKIANDFKFTANKDLMTTVYANLSMKFSIKRYGSWAALLRARAEDVIGDKSVHYKTIRSFDDDYRVKYIVTDIQGRLRSIVKEHWDEINAVLDSNEIIATMTANVETEEGLSVKELDRHFSSYLTYIQSVTGEPSNFIKDELVKIISSAMQVMAPINLRIMLIYISEHYQEDHHGQIENMIEKIMIHAFEFLRTRYEGSMSTPNLALIITELKGMYQSSRSTDKLLFELREQIDKVIHRKLKGISSAQVAAVRVGIALYVVLRALTKKKYAA